MIIFFYFEILFYENWGNTCYLRSVCYHLCSYLKYLRYLLVATYKGYFFIVPFSFLKNYILFVCLCAAHGSQRTSCGKRFSFCHVGPMLHTRATSAFTHGAISPPLKTPLVLMELWAHVVPASPSYLRVLSVSSWVLCGKLICSELNEFSSVIYCCVTIYKSACLDRRRMSKTLL